MIAPQLITSLKGLFEEENHRIVFWDDGEREFEDSIDSLILEHVNLIRLDKMGPLEIKVRLELEDLSGKYLIYSPFPESTGEKDWLMDIRLYSRTFRADRASIVLDELGLTNQAMTEHLAKHHAFFRSQDRLNRIKKWVQPGDLEADIDLKMIAVLTKAEQPDAFGILMRLFSV